MVQVMITWEVKRNVGTRCWECWLGGTGQWESVFYWKSKVFPYWLQVWVSLKPWQIAVLKFAKKKSLGLLTKNTGRESGCWGRSGPLAPSWSASGFSHSRLRDSAATFPACLPPPAWSTWSRCTFSSGVTWPSMLEQTETGQQGVSSVTPSSSLWSLFPREGTQEFCEWFEGSRMALVTTSQAAAALLASSTSTTTTTPVPSLVLPGSEVGSNSLEQRIGEVVTDAAIEQLGQRWQKEDEETRLQSREEEDGVNWFATTVSQLGIFVFWKWIWIDKTMCRHLCWMKLYWRNFNLPGDGSFEGCLCHFHHRPIIKKVSGDILLLELTRISHFYNTNWTKGTEILQWVYPQNTKCSETCWLKTRFCLRLRCLHLFTRLPFTHTFRIRSLAWHMFTARLDCKLFWFWFGGGFFLLCCTYIWNHDWKISPNTDIKL